jgi:hypothetical protein
MSWIVAVTLSVFEQAASVEARLKFLITAVNYYILSFPRGSLTSPVMNFTLKIRSDRCELKCHFETYVQMLFIFSEVFWNNRFGSAFFFFWRLHEWFERGRQYVCWHGDWSLRQYCQFVLPVFKEINASRLDLCFSVCLEPRPLEKVSQIMRTPSTKLSQLADP